MENRCTKIEEEGCKRIRKLTHLWSTTRRAACCISGRTTTLFLSLPHLFVPCHTERTCSSPRYNRGGDQLRILRMRIFQRVSLGGRIASASQRARSGSTDRFSFALTFARKKNRCRFLQFPREIARRLDGDSKRNLSRSPSSVPSSLLFLLSEDWRSNKVARTLSRSWVSLKKIVQKLTRRKSQTFICAEGNVIEITRKVLARQVFTKKSYVFCIADTIEHR